MHKIGAELLWESKKGRVLLDVRTPAEYERGHIPDALSMPLFDNAERAEIGTLYKRVSPREAFLRGLEFVGPKMANIVRQTELLVPSKKLLIHCWRGGQRSASVAWLLSNAGFDVQLLQGGYKAYRRSIHAAFDKAIDSMVVLGGLTGSGKTEVLREIKAAGEQIIDLEKIACHKGSSFGALGEKSQPTVEQFENDLYEVIRLLDPNRAIWVENESRSIGRVYLPEGLWHSMKKAPLVQLVLPFEKRLDVLVASYANYPPGQLQEAFERIQKRLGGQHLKAALEALQEQDFRTAAQIALRYYDKSYRYFVERSQVDQLISFPVEEHQPRQTAMALIDLWREQNFTNSTNSNHL
ncbi:MAG: tRNA 2-selenouridine(34) synthase MnmH [Bacteroidota bacterium]